MPRKVRSPFFRKDRALWYVQIRGKQINLGPDKEEAWKEYHRLMAEGTPTPTTRITFVEVVDRFLKWTKKNRSEVTWAWYNSFFANILPAMPPGLLATKVKVHHVTYVMEQNADRWASADSQHWGCYVIRRALKWAFEQEIIDRLPLGGMPMPQRQPREKWYEDDEWRAIIEAIDHPDFVTYITMMRETGCRPREIREVTAAEFDRQNRRFVFKLQNSKGKKYHRRVLLSDTAMRLVEEAVAQYPQGPMFRYHPAKRYDLLTPKKLMLHYGVTIETVRAWIDNGLLRATNVKDKRVQFRVTWDDLVAFESATGIKPAGLIWEKRRINDRIKSLEKKLGWRPMPYAIRHTFAVHALRNGVDALYVAELLGHRDLTMVAKVYGHIGANNADMQRRLKQALAPALNVVGPADDVAASA